MTDDKLEIEVIVNGKKAIAQLGKVEGATDKLGEQTEKTDKQIKSSTDSIKTSWLAVGAAVAAVTGTMTSATKAYAAQLKAETALNGALRANSIAGDDTLQMWKQYASQMQELTLFGDEATLQQLALIKAYNLSDIQMRSLIEASMNLASATGMTLEGAVRNLAKTYSGMTGELGESIPQLKELTKTQLRNGEAVALVNGLYRDQARAIAETDYGKLVQAYNTLGDTMEEVGGLFVKLAASVGTGFVSQSFNWFFSNIDDGFITQYEWLLKIRRQWNLLSGDTREAAQIQKEINAIYSMRDEMDGQTEEEQMRNRLLRQGLELSVVEDMITAWKKLGEAKKEVRDKPEDEDAIKRQAKYEQELINLYIRKLKITEGQKVSDMVAFENRLKNMDLESSQIQELMKQYRELYSLEEEVEAREKAEEAKRKAMEETRKKAEDISGKIADSIVDSAMTGKLSFADMAQSMIREMMRVMAQRMIMNAITGSFFGGLFHTGGEVKHTGGTIGANLPTYHTGMRSDERMAKLQVGESVINRHGTARNAEAIDAMNKGYKVGSGGGDNITTAEINFNVQAIDAASFNSFLVSNKQTIEGIINNSLKTNGSVRKTIKMVG